MKRILSLMILLLALASTNANAWFFFFLPGGVIDAVTDGITGSEGEHCVDANAKIGDAIRLPGGGQGTVKSLSGTSIRCTQPEAPIRALLDTSNNSSASIEAQKPQFASSSRGTGESCNDHFECAGSMRCVSGRCALPPIEAQKPKLAKGAACNISGDCDSDLFCIVGHCGIYSKTIAGEACLATAECSGALECISGKCIQTKVEIPATPPIVPAPVVLPKAEESPLKVPLVQNNDATQRLRDLKELLKEGVITQKDYDTKKKEILKSM